MSRVKELELEIKQKREELKRLETQIRAEKYGKQSDALIIAIIKELNTNEFRERLVLHLDFTKGTGTYEITMNSVGRCGGHEGMPIFTVQVNS